MHRSARGPAAAAAIHPLTRVPSSPTIYARALRLISNYGLTGDHSAKLYIYIYPRLIYTPSTFHRKNSPICDIIFIFNISKKEKKQKYIAAVFYIINRAHLGDVCITQLFLHHRKKEKKNIRERQKYI